MTATAVEQASRSAYAMSELDLTDDGLATSQSHMVDSNDNTSKTVVVVLNRTILAALASYCQHCPQPIAGSTASNAWRAIRRLGHDLQLARNVLYGNIDPLSVAWPVFENDVCIANEHLLDDKE